MQTATIRWALRMRSALDRDIYMPMFPHNITPGGNSSYPRFTSKETEMRSCAQVIQPVSGGAGIQIEGGKDPEHNL